MAQGGSDAADRMKKLRVSHVDPDAPYPMDLPKLGHAIIVNNVAGEMPGSQVDVEALKTVYQTVGFEVHVHTDCDVQDMRKLKRWMLKDETHVDCNSFSLTIICHGNDKGHLLDKNRKRAWITEDIVGDLSEVETLAGKPKLLVLQACRGRNWNEGTTVTDRGLADDDDLETTHILPDKADVFIAFATVPGYRAYGGDHSGSAYLQAFATFLQEQYMKRPLDRIYLMVKQHMIKAEQGEQKLRQVSEERNSLTHLLYFSEFHEKGSSKSSSRTDDEMKRKDEEEMRRRMMEEIDKERRAELEAERQRRIELEEEIKRLREKSKPDPTTAPVQSHSSQSSAQSSLSTSFAQRGFSKSSVPIGASSFPAQSGASKSSTKTHSSKSPVRSFKETKTFFDQCNTAKPSVPANVQSSATKSTQGPQTGATRTDSSGQASQTVQSLLRGDSTVPVKTSGRVVRLTNMFTCQMTLFEVYGFTVLPSSGEIVIQGQARESDPVSLYTYRQSTWSVRGLEKTGTIKMPCNHGSGSLLPVTIDNKELLAVSCPRWCGDIKLIDLKLVKTDIAYTQNKLSRMVRGERGVMYVKIDDSDELLVLKCSGAKFTKCGSTSLKGWADFKSLTYLPNPFRSLVYNYDGHTIEAISCDSFKSLWKVNTQIDGAYCRGPSLLFAPSHGVLLAFDGGNGRVLALDPRDGSHLRTVKLPDDITEILGVCLHDDNVIVLHYDRPRDIYKISYFRLC